MRRPSPPTRDRSGSRSSRAPAVPRSGTTRSTFFVLALVGGCRSNAPSDERTELAVFAASSLTEAFEELERGFEATHPHVDVQLTFAGSQVLRLQIEQGATADVYASADERHMQALVQGGHVSPPAVFAHNELAVIVPANRSSSIQSFDDLDSADRLVIGAVHVPVGYYTQALFDRAAVHYGEAFAANLRANVVSEESNVRLVRAKVELGEADAAVVYRTDATGSDRVGTVAIPDAINVHADYPIAVTVRTTHRESATAFVNYATSRAGAATLKRHGFMTETP